MALSKKFPTFWIGWMLTGIVAAVIWLAFERSRSPESPPPPSAQIRVEPLQPGQLQARYVVDISVHSRRELEALLERVERLSAGKPPPENGPDIALVLHGPEISFFAKQNYREYKQLVDRVAALDRRGIIDTKMCQTIMRARSIRESDVPDFIEFVPFGPDEVRRLVEQENRVRM